jgi:hypothetical protein
MQDIFLPHLLVTLLSAAISMVLAYYIYRKSTTSASLWAFIASFLPDWPVFMLVPFGTIVSANLLFFTHTIGIFIQPIMLIILDIFLIEAQILKFIVPVIKFLHLGSQNRAIRLAEKSDYWLEKLEKYDIVPRPIRLQKVYAIGVLAGVVHLVVNWVAGFL